MIQPHILVRTMTKPIKQTRYWAKHSLGSANENCGIPGGLSAVCSPILLKTDNQQPSCMP